MRLLLLWGAPLLAALAFWFALEWLHGSRPEPSDARLLERARFEVLAPEPAPTAEVTLPHDWRAGDPRVERARYRVAVALPARAASGPDLYLPSADTSTRVLVNEVLVEEGEPFLALDSRLWHVPLYVPVPAALWREGENEIALEVSPSWPGEAYLAPFYAGPRESLRPHYELRHFLQVTGVQVLVVAMVAFALFLGLLWLLRRKEEAALWFAASLVVVALGFWNLVSIQMWVTKPSWNWLGVVVPAWLMTSITLFTHRLLGLRRPRLELAIAALAAVGTVFFAATNGSAAYHAARPFWGLAVLCFGLYPGYLTVRRAVCEPSVEASLLLGSGLILNVAGAHDIGIANGRVPLSHDMAIAWAVVVGIAIMAWVFVRRFIVALDTSEALSAELEQRVAAKHAELERNYVRLRRLEQERAVAQERERIMAELHDGIGGRLVSTLAVVRSGGARADELETSLRCALDEIRLMVHSLELGDADLASVLASLRARLAPVLERAGITVDWPVEDVPALHGFGPEQALQLTRIAQEAIANVLKHAGARTVSVRTDVGSGSSGARELTLRFCDDGCGFSPDEPGGGAGRGLGNMRRRAESIGARFSVRSSADRGTEVSLVLPVDSA